MNELTPDQSPTEQPLPPGVIYRGKKFQIFTNKAGQKVVRANPGYTISQIQGALKKHRAAEHARFKAMQLLAPGMRINVTELGDPNSIVFTPNRK